MNMKRYFIIGGIIVVAALVSTLLYTVLGNHGPVIVSLTAEPDRVRPRGSCQIVCNATAPDSAELSYSWSAAGDGKITGEGTAITWTAPDSVGSYDVTVTVSDSHGAEAKKYLIITVDNPPSITSLAANASWANPSGTIQVTCAASDPDGDELSYEWTPDGGHISGTGPIVDWIAPDGVGLHNITVVVRDGYGGEAVGEVSLSVNSGIPPAVEKLVVTPVTRYLRYSTIAGCNFDVYKDKHYTIECVASNASGDLLYQWSSTDGEISGEGPVITWISPNKLSTSVESIDVTVTVIVSDSAGNSTIRKVVFHMASCTCNAFPLESGEVLF